MFDDVGDVTFFAAFEAAGGGFDFPEREAGGWAGKQPLSHFVKIIYKRSIDDKCSSANGAVSQKSR